MPTSILFVCTGNICRSPTAEVLLRHRLADGFTAASAGLMALQGHPIDPRAEAALVARGLTAGAHAARQLTPALVEQADLVLAMERRHLTALRALVPDARRRMFLLGRWRGNLEVPDPYGGENAGFETTCRTIDDVLEPWMMHLSSS